MITVEQKLEQYTVLTVKELKNMLTTGKHQAFIGGGTSKVEGQVYLITYLGIVLMNNPHQTWSSEDAKFKVYQFVNLCVTATAEGKE